MAGRSMSLDIDVEIPGLLDFRRDLRDLTASREFAEAVDEAEFDTAKRIVEGASIRARQQGGVAAKAVKQGALKATRSAREAVVDLRNSGRTPFAFGAEFGSLRFGQFKQWRGNQWRSWFGGPGYFLHPEIREQGETVVDEYWKRIENVFDSVFPN